MARTSLVWSPPSEESLVINGIADLAVAKKIRSVWRATTIAALVAIVGKDLHDQLSGLPVGTFGFKQLKRHLVCALAGLGQPVVLGHHRPANRRVWHGQAAQVGVPTLCFAGRRMFIAVPKDLLDSGIVSHG